jgi:hypothetical protein
LRCTGSVAYSRRIARWGAQASKTSHVKEGSNGGITSRDCCFACRLTRYFTKSQARSQKSRGWHNSQSGWIASRVACSHAQSKGRPQKSSGIDESFTIAWEILAWRFVQAEKLRGSQSGGRHQRPGKKRERRSSE